MSLFLPPFVSPVLVPVLALLRSCPSLLTVVLVAPESLRLPVAGFMRRQGGPSGLGQTGGTVTPSPSQAGLLCLYLT